MLKVKKIILLMVIVSLVIGLIPCDVFGVFTAADEFWNYLGNKGELYSSNGYKANFDTYRNYNYIVVYGKSEDVPNNESSTETGKLEYRYLGYTLTGEKYTNTYFRADPGGGGNPDTWVYVTVGDAVESWDGLDEDQREYMLNKKLRYMDIQYNKTVASMGGTSYAKVLNPAAWSHGFSVYTRHKAINYDGVRYATLYGDPMGSCSLNCSVTTPSSTYTIKSTDSSITVPVTVTTTATLQGTYVKASQIKTIQAVFEGSKKDEEKKTSTSITTNKVFQRANFSPGTHSIALKGQGYLESIFGDKYDATGTKTITLIVEEPPYPYVKVTSTAEPAKKKFDGNDINVTVTISATLHNYTQTSNIDYWVLYARKAEITTASSLNRPAGLSASGSFTFTIPKEKLDGVDEYTQDFITRAKVVFKDGTFKDAPSSCVTLVYKDVPSVEEETPPPPPVPEAFIKCYGAFKENRKITIDLTGSKNHKASLNVLAITALSGGTAADIKYSGALNGITAKDVLFKKAGRYKVELTVYDSDGKSDTDSRILEIEPDNPPIQDFRTASPVYRDYADYNQALIKVSNFSYSDDQDLLTNLNVVYYYDSDNDGSFDDETPEAIYDGINKDELVLKVSEIGKYKFKFTLKESFGQPTIPEFITPADYRQSESESVVEVANYVPVVDFSMVKKKKVDVYINVGETAYSDLNVINSKINSDVKPVLESNGIAANFRVRQGEGRTIGMIPQRHTLAQFSGGFLAVTSQGLVFNSSTYETFSQPTNVAGVFAWNSYYIALTKDGRVWGWGNNNGFGQIPTQNLGDTHLAQPTIYPDLTDVIDVVCTPFYAAFLKRDGTVWYSGMFIPYQYVYGSGADVPYTGAQRLFSQFNDVVDIEGGRGYILLLRKDGTVWGYGDNTFFQLATVPCQGSTDGYGCWWRLCKNVSQIPGLSSIKRIYSRDFTSYAVAEDGTVWGWGRNFALYPLGPPECDKYGNTGYGVSKGYNWHPVIIPGINGNDYTSIANVYINNATYTQLVKNDGIVWKYSDYYGLQRRDKLYAGYKKGLHTVLENLDNVIAMTYPDSGSHGCYILRGNNEVWYVGDSYVDRSPYYYENSCKYSWGPDVSYRTDMTPPFTEPTNNIYNTVESLSWQGGAERFFAAIGDTAFPELSDNDKLAGILENFLTDRVNFVGMGRSTNQALLQTFIQRNSNNGTYIDNTNLNTALSSLTTYILNKMATQENIIDRYILLGEDIEYNTFYTDSEHDPEYSSRWKFTHNPNYFDNSLGIISNSGQFISSPITVFDKVGHYEVAYQARDNPKIDDRFNNYRLWSKNALMNVYVHRKPIAEFSVSFSGADDSGNYITNVSEYSYDWDHTSRQDRGLVQKTWKWKEAGSTSWNNGSLPSVLTPNKIYLVQLEVKDLEGAWSDPCVKPVETSPSNLPPIVNCLPAARDWGNTNVTVTVTATDPSGDYTNTGYVWSTSPVYPSSGWQTTANSSFNTTQSFEGVWYLHLEAFDLAGNSFYMRGGPYLIDKTPPVVDATPKSHEGQGVAVTVAASDTGGSGLKEIRYAWTNSTGKPSSGWASSFTGGFQTIQNNNGTWYLHMEAYDNAGNSFYRYRGPYVVNTLRITGVTIEGYWNHWRGQVDMFGRQLSVEPHRFLSMETVRINVNTAGYADKVVVRFSPELESMQFTDIHGNTYDYAEYFGCHINFPADSTFIIDSGLDNNYVYWEYTLPLAYSSKSWDDDRIKEQYRMVVTAYKGGKSVTYEIDDIDITGNVYDLTYIQPVN